MDKLSIGTACGIIWFIALMLGVLWMPNSTFVVVGGSATIAVAIIWALVNILYTDSGGI